METKNIALSFKKEYFTKSRSILYLLVILCFSIQDIFGTTYIWVRPYEIRFDYESGHDDDAITIRDDDGDLLTKPEWKYSPYRNNKIAYIKSQTDRKIQVRFNSNCDDMHLIINLTVNSGTGIGEICNHVVMNYEDMEWITLTLDGSIPSTVDVRQFTWKWEVYAITNESGYCSATSTNYTTHTYYTLLSTPLSPMTQPWSSVLDHACDWASGESTSSGAAQKVVEGLYNNSEFLYDVYYGSARYTSYGNHSFNLTLMLSEFGSAQGTVNCYDMGKAATIFNNALGCNSDYAFTIPFGYLNCIKAIGRGWSNNPFYANPNYDPDPIVGEDDDASDGRSKFGNHAFCEVGSNIYDATLKVDTDGNPDASPHTESWATGWIWTTYKSKVIDNDPSSNPGTPTNYSFSVY